jgi:8-oxo-dGTP diphosphatase
VRVAALLVHEGRIVVVRHRSAGSTYHLLPGGGVDYRETLADALSREVREETGFEAVIGSLLFINDTIDPFGTRHVVNITFSATIVGGELTQSPEDHNVEAVEFIEIERLRELDLRPPMADALIDAVQGATTPGYLGSLFTAGR